MLSLLMQRIVQIKISFSTMIKVVSLIHPSPKKLVKFGDLGGNLWTRLPAYLWKALISSMAASNIMLQEIILRPYPQTRGSVKGSPPFADLIKYLLKFHCYCRDRPLYTNMFTPHLKNFVM